MNKNDMMCQIMALDFTLIDLCQYLDTHPYDDNAIEYYMDYKQECEKLKREYEQKYGPLTAGSYDKEKWQWIENPWPWEEMFQ